MRYVATQPLRWGEETIPAGALVPAGEQGRDYALLLHLGQISEIDDTAGLSDDEVAAELKKALARIAELEDGIKELEAGEDVAPVEVPDGVVPGETPGWPVGTFVIPLSDEQREALASDGVSGTLSPDAVAELGVGVMRVRVALAEGAQEDPHADADTNQAESKGEAPNDALPDSVTDLGGGWFELPSGRKVRKKDIDDAALADTSSEEE